MHSGYPTWCASWPTRRRARRSGRAEDRRFPRCRPGGAVEGEDPLGDQGGEADGRYVGDTPVDDVSWHPPGPELGVEAPQRLHLDAEAAVEAADEPRSHRLGPIELGALLQQRAEG